MVPGAVLQGDGEDVHHRVVQGLAGGVRVELLRVAGSGADHGRGCGGWCAARSTRSGRDRRSARASGGRDRSAPGSGTRRSVPWCSCPGWRAWPRPDRAAAPGTRASGPPSSQAMTPSSPSQIGAGAPSPRIARSTASMATLPAMRGRVRLPAGDLALAGLPGRRGQVQRLTDRLVDRLGVEPEHGADAGGRRGAEMRDMVDLVLVQADRADQVDLDLVAGGQTADQVGAARHRLLGDREDRRDVVAGMRVLGGQEGVVEVEFTHRDAVGPGRPLRRVASVDAEHRGAVAGAGAPAPGRGRRRPGGGSPRPRTTAALSMIRLTIISAVSAGPRPGRRRPRRSSRPGARGGESPRRCAVSGRHDQA